MKSARAIAEWIALVLSITAAIASAALVLRAVDPLTAEQPYHRSTT